MATAARQAEGAAIGPWGLIGHAIRRPVAGWDAAAASRAGWWAMLVGVALPLTAIGPVARMVHALAFGNRPQGIIDYRPTLGGAVLTALVGWAVAWVAAVLLAWAIGTMAPWFGGGRDRPAAARAAVLGAAPFWLASVFAALPHFTWLEGLGAYGLLLLFVGAPRLMAVAEDRASVFGGAVVGVAIVLLIASLAIPAALSQKESRPTVRTAHGRQVVVGAPAIAGSKLVADDKPSRPAVTPGTRIAVAQGAVDPDSMQALLPASIAGFARTALVAQSNWSAGAVSADAKGTYVSGTDSFTLTITDAGAPGALATSNSLVAGAYNRSSDRGYQRSNVVNGTRVTEKWTYASRGGLYARTIGGRFSVEAAGVAPSMDVLRAAVASIDGARLQAMAPHRAPRS